MEHSKDNIDTIAAIATPPGRGGVGIVRVSGPLSIRIAQAILPHQPTPRKAEYLPFKDWQGQTIDEGIALFFPAPNSFTGENILELQGHGGPVVMDMLLKTTLHFGARLARPGEFSERAFLNNKLDLAQAEAIADLIDSASEQAARSALRSLQGEFSLQIKSLLEQLIQLRMYVESAIDFPEEEIDFLADQQLATNLEAAMENMRGILNRAKQGCLLREGLQVVIAGAPNVGKSTLINQLTGKETSIVTDIPGTTRDVLREHVLLDGLPLQIIDTAGLRHSDDPVEQEGIRRAWKEIEQADQILYVTDRPVAESAFIQRLRQAGPGLTFIHNKIDLSKENAALTMEDQEYHIRVSAKTGSGMEYLKNHLKKCVGYQAAGEGQIIARRRHVDALKQAMNCIQQGKIHLQNSDGELLAEELRLAQLALNEITGEFSSDDLLGRIFSSFCIGK